MKRPGDEPGLCCLSFLLLTFRMGLFTMLVGRLRVLFGACGVFLPLGMIALAVMFGGGSMGLGSVFVMFCCFVVFVSGHFCYSWCSASSLAASNRCPRNRSFLRRNT
jgi:hypothetical protein